jgi:phosphatidylglycerol:prolipoprotein diacylglycerol transferase
MELGIDPVILYIGGFGVRWYLFFELAALSVYIVFFFVEAVRKGIAPGHVAAMVGLTVILGLVLGRLADFVERPAFYLEDAARWYSPGGIRITGILAGGLAARLAYCGMARLSFWRASDAVAPGIPLALALGRLGCFINGCCHGTVCPDVLSVVYTDPDALAPLLTPLWPVQLYQAAWNLAVFLVLWNMRARLERDGLLYLLFLMLYAAGDLLTRFAREGVPFAGPLQFAQFIDVFILLAAAALFLVMGGRKAVDKSAGR